MTLPIRETKQDYTVGKTVEADGKFVAFMTIVLDPTGFPYSYGYGPTAADAYADAVRLAKLFNGEYAT